MGERLQTIIEDLKEVSKMLDVCECSNRYIVACDEAVDILEKVQKLVSAASAYEELLKG